MAGPTHAGLVYVLSHANSIQSGKTACIKHSSLFKVIEGYKGRTVLIPPLSVRTPKKGPVCTAFYFFKDVIFPFGLSKESKVSTTEYPS
jgi:hypothetical protein